MNNKNKYKWALVHSKTGKLLRSDTGRRAIFKTRQEARWSRKTVLGDLGRPDLTMLDIKVVKRDQVK